MGTELYQVFKRTGEIDLTLEAISGYFKTPQAAYMDILERNLPVLGKYFIARLCEIGNERHIEGYSSPLLAFRYAVKRNYISGDGSLASISKLAKRFEEFKYKSYHDMMTALLNDNMLEDDSNNYYFASPVFCGFLVDNPGDIMDADELGENDTLHVTIQPDISLVSLASFNADAPPVEVINGEIIALPIRPHDRVEVLQALFHVNYTLILSIVELCDIEMNSVEGVKTVNYSKTAKHCIELLRRRLKILEDLPLEGIVKDNSGTDL